MKEEIIRSFVLGRHDCGNNDDKDEDDDASNQAHSHLHVLPPHLLAHSVGAAAETLGGDGQIVGLILQGIQSLATLGNFVDVLSHYTNGVINLRLKRLCSGISTLLGSGLAAGDVWVVRGFLVRHDCGCLWFSGRKYAIGRVK